MGEVFNQGLLITGIGMGLVFVMILILWGIMALLVKLTNRPEDDSDDDGEEEALVLAYDSPESSGDQSPLAAAIAVAAALEADSSFLAFKPRPSASANSDSAWLTAGRTQQLYSNTIRGRNR
jgi:Na+-transporting methylmalonyl-CoA/oxaloacetate decarboxylase gamma subunit